MIRPIMDKQFFLKQPSVEATATDVSIARDLADTLEAHRPSCVGMKANMIGERKRIIAVLDETSNVLVMLNPEIIKCGGPYNAMEGCLSLPGEREAQRYEHITVSYQDEGMRNVQRLDAPMEAGARRSTCVNASARNVPWKLQPHALPGTAWRPDALLGNRDVMPGPRNRRRRQRRPEAAPSGCAPIANAAPPPP